MKVYKKQNIKNYKNTRRNNVNIKKSNLDILLRRRLSPSIKKKKLIFYSRYFNYQKYEYGSDKRKWYKLKTSYLKYSFENHRGLKRRRKFIESQAWEDNLLRLQVHPFLYMKFFNGIRFEKNYRWVRRGRIKLQYLTNFFWKKVWILFRSNKKILQSYKKAILRSRKNFERKCENVVFFFHRKKFTTGASYHFSREKFNSFLFKNEAKRRGKVLLTEPQKRPRPNLKVFHVKRVIRVREYELPFFIPISILKPFKKPKKIKWWKILKRLHWNFYKLQRLKKKEYFLRLWKRDLVSKLQYKLKNLRNMKFLDFSAFMANRLEQFINDAGFLKYYAQSRKVIRAGFIRVNGRLIKNIHFIIKPYDIVESRFYPTANFFFNHKKKLSSIQKLRLWEQLKFKKTINFLKKQQGKWNKQWLKKKHEELKKRNQISWNYKNFKRNKFSKNLTFGQNSYKKFNYSPTRYLSYNSKSPRQYRNKSSFKNVRGKWVYFHKKGSYLPWGRFKDARLKKIKPVLKGSKFLRMQKFLKNNWNFNKKIWRNPPQFEIKCFNNSWYLHSPKFGIAMSLKKLSFTKNSTSSRWLPNYYTYKLLSLWD